METTIESTETRKKTYAHPMMRVPTRFEGIYVDGAGNALAWTDGHAAIVVGVDSIAEAVHALQYAHATSGALPDIASVQRVFAAESARRFVASALLSRRSQPNAAIVARAEEEKAQRIARAEAQLAPAIARLEQKRADLKSGKWNPEGPRETVAALQAKVTEYRDDLRRARSWDTSDLAGFGVGPAHFDMRVVQRALRALGASKGELHVQADPLAPALLMTSKGVGLVMPYRALTA